MARKRPYVKIDQSIGDHPRSIRISPKLYLAAIGLHVIGIGWCDRMRTDGEIPAAIIPRLTIGNCQPALSELVRVGLWEVTENGYAIHDYLDWQDSAETLASKSKAARESVSRRSDRSTKRSTERTTNSSTNGCTTEPSRAEPSPTEPNQEESVPLSSAAPGFDECWDAYPNHQYRNRAEAHYSAAIAEGIDPAQVLEACKRVPRDHQQSLGFFISDGTWRDHLPKPRKPKAEPCAECGGSGWVLPRESEVAIHCPKCSESKAEVR